MESRGRYEQWRDLLGVLYVDQCADAIGEPGLVVATPVVVDDWVSRYADVLEDLAVPAEGRGLLVYFRLR